MTLPTADDIGILLFQHDKNLKEIEDDLGDSPAVRAQRRASLYTHIVATFDSQLERIRAEKAEIECNCKQLIKELDGMSKSLGGENLREDPFVEEPEVKHITITKPLRASLEAIKEQHNEMKRNYLERLDYVKELNGVLLDYQTRLGSDFLQVKIPDLDAPLGVPDLSLRFINQSLLTEINRCSEELKRRRRLVSQFCTHIIQLIAEREIKLDEETEFDRAIVLSRDNPDIIGFSQDVLDKLTQKKEELIAEKHKRETHLESLKAAIMPLWEKLGVEVEDAKTFISSHRGVTDKTISAYEKELERLKELKRQNLELFIRESRKTLKELWDALYFSCQEMQSFDAAFVDVFSEAALIVHEDEVARLQQLYAKQKPLLDLVEKYYSLEKERKELEKSSQDTSRLMGRGNRDPGRLLREEKARKKICRELPKAILSFSISQKLREKVHIWENENSQPFLVYGNRFLEELEPQRSSSQLSNHSSSRPNSSKGNRPTTPGKPRTPSRSRAPFREMDTNERPSSPTKTGMSTIRKGSTSISRKPSGSVSASRINNALIQNSFGSLKRTTSAGTLYSREVSNSSRETRTVSASSSNWEAYETSEDELEDDAIFEGLRIRQKMRHTKILEEDENGVVLVNEWGEEGF